MLMQDVIRLSPSQLWGSVAAQFVKYAAQRGRVIDDRMRDWLSFVEKRGQTRLMGRYLQSTPKSVLTVGHLDDWVTLNRKVGKLLVYARGDPILIQWYSELSVVVRQILAYQKTGVALPGFWMKMFQPETDHDMHIEITGWITVFLSVEERSLPVIDFSLAENLVVSPSAEPENPPAEPENLATEPENLAAPPSGEPENLATEPENLATEPENPPAEPENTAASHNDEPDNLAVDPENLVSPGDDFCVL